MVGEEGFDRTGDPASGPLQSITKLRMQKSLDISIEAF